MCTFKKQHYSVTTDQIFSINHCKTCKYKILDICLVIRKIIIYNYRLQLIYGYILFFCYIYYFLFKIII